MSWRIEVEPTAEKQYLKLDKTEKQRIHSALLELDQAENPLFHPAVRHLAGKLKGDYCLRVGDWRVLFTPDRDEKMIYVYAIFPRGDAY
jgi:mRNA-degrading endonuclease RelE of RelBE toxin-antitoxin system